MCYGPAAPDGYGVCYNPKDEKIHLAVTAFNTSPETDSSNFAKVLEQSLLDMRTVLGGTVASKLWNVFSLCDAVCECVIDASSADNHLMKMEPFCGRGTSAVQGISLQV